MDSESFLLQLQICYSVVKANVGEITPTESLEQPAPAGNCLNWILGHIVSTRSDFLHGIGAEPVWGEADRRRYARHEPPIVNARLAKPLEEIWEAYELSQQRIRKHVSGLTPQLLDEKAQFSPANDPNETIGSLLTVFAFHDAYHTGQTGILRRLLGKPPRDL